MGLFKQKQKDYLGIDFGAGGIKVLQLSRVGDGRGKLFTYGFSERNFEEVGSDYLEKTEQSGELLKSICKKARTTTNQGIAALPIPAVFSSVLSITKVPKKELRQAIEWEAKKLIPLPLEEVTLDFKQLDFPSNGEGAMQVLLTAAPKGIIDKYIAIAKYAGINLVSLETEAFALIRSLIGNDPAPTVIVDLGAARSNILIVDRGIPIFTRSVEIGGKHCTEAIAKNLGLDLTRAEGMKRDLGDAPLPGTAAGALPAILRDVLDPLVNELKYSFSVYKSRSAAVSMPSRIILAGGGAGLPGIAEFFANEFNMRTVVGDPWELVHYHDDLSDLLDSLGSRFAVSVGLALRNL